MQCTYFIFLLRKYKGSLHLILNGHGECTVILSVLFTCLIDLLQLLFIDLVWYGVVWFSVYCICEAFLYTCVVFDFCIGLSYVFCFLLKKKVNTELICFFVGNFWSTYISTLNCLFQQMSPGTLYPGRIHFWKWVIAEASIPSF